MNIDAGQTTPTLVCTAGARFHRYRWRVMAAAAVNFAVLMVAAIAPLWWEPNRWVLYGCSLAIIYAANAYTQACMAFNVYAYQEHPQRGALHLTPGAWWQSTRQAVRWQLEMQMPGMVYQAYVRRWQRWRLRWIPFSTPRQITQIDFDVLAPGDKLLAGPHLVESHRALSELVSALWEESVSRAKGDIK